MSIGPRSVFFLLALAACGTTRHEPPPTAEQLRRIVEDCQRALFQHGDYDRYIAAFSPDSQLVSGRGPDASDDDVVYPSDDFRRIRRFRFDGVPTDGLRLDVDDPELRWDDDTAILRVRATSSFPDDSGITYGEEFGEIYELRFVSGDWRIVENRYWPIRIGDITFDAAHWRRLDAAVTASRRRGNLADETGWLMESLRFPEAWEAATRWSESSPEEIDAWWARAFAASLCGKVDDSLAAFRRIREIEPRAELPEFATKRLASD
ncbi:MAG: hypothetical protein KDB80_12385 [Planctomycetes bacterium]|nr:hypothetical protein [Planctomycetota bacterium]